MFSLSLSMMTPVAVSPPAVKFPRLSTMEANRSNVSVDSQKRSSIMGISKLIVVPSPENFGKIRVNTESV